jgi:hypothetical protein
MFMATLPVSKKFDAENSEDPVLAVNRLSLS